MRDGFLLSVIVPCYNVEKYIGTFLDSLINQTIGIENIQLILVDDMSTDSTPYIISDYESRYSNNILYIKLSEKGGAGGARNIGFSYATGKYVTYADSDDYISPNMYSIMISALEKNGCELAMCEYTSFKDNSEIQTFSECDITDFAVYNSIDTEARKRLFLEHSQVASIWTKVFRNDFLTSMDPYFPECLRFEDIFFNWRLLLHVPSICVTDMPLYLYRKNPNSISNSNTHQAYQRPIRLP